MNALIITIYIKYMLRKKIWNYLSDYLESCKYEWLYSFETLQCNLNLKKGFLISNAPQKLSEDIYHKLDGLRVFRFAEVYISQVAV